jgi:hypothetical protein
MRACAVAHHEQPEAGPFPSALMYCVLPFFAVSSVASLSYPPFSPIPHERSML